MSHVVRNIICAYFLQIISCADAQHGHFGKYHKPGLAHVLEFVTWGFEDYDLPNSDFVLDFPFEATIVKVSGYISASPLPGKSHIDQRKSGYIRQNLLSCRTSTSDKDIPIKIGRYNCIQS
jgi:hypothetical protein